MSVDLPAPLAPTRPTIPGSTSSVSPDSAATPLAYRLVSDSVAIRVTTLNLGAVRQNRIGRHPCPYPDL